MKSPLRTGEWALASAFLLAALTSTAPAWADDDAALTAFSSGRFLEAAAAAQASPNHEHLSIAARALLAHVVLEADSRTAQARIDEVISVSERLLLLSPQSVEARLDLAFALGVKSRRMGRLEAMRKGYARRGKRLIDEAVANEPNNAWAQAMLGGWHCEVLRRGGAVGARLYGAKFEHGAEAFERARQLAPDDPAIALQYGVALLGLDAVRHAEQARALFADAAAASARDAFDGLMAAEASRLGSLMDSRGALAAAADANRRFAS